MPWLDWTLEKVDGVFSCPPNRSFLIFSQCQYLEHLMPMYLQQHELKWLDIYNTNLMWAFRIVCSCRIIKLYEKKGLKNSAVMTQSLCLKRGRTHYFMHVKNCFISSSMLCIFWVHIVTLLFYLRMCHIMWWYVWPLEHSLYGFVFPLTHKENP